MKLLLDQGLPRTGAGVRITITLIALAVGSSATAAQKVSKSYWLLARNDGRTWCGYANQREFKLDAARLRPPETAKVTFSSGSLAEVTVQVEPESADWVVVDRYTPSAHEVLLRRANRLAQPNLEVIEVTTIREAKWKTFHIVRIATLDGKKAQAPSSLGDYLPSVPVITNLASTPFMRIVAEMQRQSLAKFCRDR